MEGCLAFYPILVRLSTPETRAVGRSVNLYIYGVGRPARIQHETTNNLLDVALSHLFSFFKGKLFKFFPDFAI
jgi:hypothetical protein